MGTAASHACWPSETPGQKAGTGSTIGEPDSRGMAEASLLEAEGLAAAASADLGDCQLAHASSLGCRHGVAVRAWPVPLAERAGPERGERRDHRVPERAGAMNGIAGHRPDEALGPLVAGAPEDQIAGPAKVVAREH